MPLIYVKGDATSDELRNINVAKHCNANSNKPQIIPHIVNIMGKWGHGFVVALSKRWALPETAYRSFCKHMDAGLGDYQLIQVNNLTITDTNNFIAIDNTYVANLFAQKFVASPSMIIPNGEIPLDYQALRVCLDKLAVDVIKLEASVHMPKIGCGLARGSWDVVSQIIEEALPKSAQVFVYEL